MVPGCAKWAQGQTEMCRSHTAAKSMCSSVETTRTAGKAWLAFTETKLVAKCDVDETGTSKRREEKRRVFEILSGAKYLH